MSHKKPPTIGLKKQKIAARDGRRATNFSRVDLPDSLACVSNFLAHLSKRTGFSTVTYGHRALGVPLTARPNDAFEETCTNLSELGHRLKTNANEKLKLPRAFPSKEVQALTLRTQFLNDELLGSSAKSLEPDARPYRKRGDFVSSLRGVIDRLRAAAIEFASIAILIAGFIIAALCALDLMDMLR
jgi:hypothetical protein